MPNRYKLILIIASLIGFVTYDILYAAPVADIRFYNLIVELSFSLMCAVLFLSIEGLKDKTFFRFLSFGFFLVFVSMLVDGLDQLHMHGELYTAIFEKTTLLIGFASVFIGVKSWITDYGFMNKELEKQAYTDSLTGLYNRRGMLKKFTAMNIRAEQNNEPLSFIIADLDDFKILNDTLGHVSGDEYLANLGASLLTLADNNTVIGRWGGEEFAVCMLGRDIKQAFDLAEIIRQKVSNTEMPLAIKTPNMTVSLGVSEKKPGEHFMETIKRADRSLYLAKNQGKNRSVAD